MHGPIMQLGYVVGDLTASVDNWARRTGAGPFIHMPGMTFGGWTYRGASQAVTLDIAFAQLGDKMIELIQPSGAWPNVYGEAPLQPGECRPHHHAFLVSDLDRAAATLDAGLPVTTGRLNEQVELRYYDCRSTLGLFIELITDTPSTRDFFVLSERAAAQWDGSAPYLVSAESVA
jgi:hypothetical protein